MSRTVSAVSICRTCSHLVVGKIGVACPNCGTKTAFDHSVVRRCWYDIVSWAPTGCLAIGDEELT